MREKNLTGNKCAIGGLIFLTIINKKGGTSLFLNITSF